jgi:hypothetical protein
MIRLIFEVFLTLISCFIGFVISQIFIEKILLIYPQWSYR